MNDDTRNGLTPAEENAFRSLPRDVTPPAGLERRVIRALRKRNLVTRPGWPWTRVAVLVLGAAASFSIGVFSADTLMPPEPASEPPAVPVMGPVMQPDEPAGLRDYYVLLYQDESYDYATPQEFPARVAEYNEWGAMAADMGRLVGGEKLADSGVVILPGTDGVIWRRGSDVPGFLAGFYIIRAASDEEAAMMARNHPHLRYGGGVGIRAVDPVP